jgi:hypothetical protein
MKYMNFFILAAKYIGDEPSSFTCTKGGKYEMAWKSRTSNKPTKTMYSLNISI